MADLSPAREITERLRAEPAQVAGRIRSRAQQGAAASLPESWSRSTLTREPRFRHDPAYTVPPLPTLAVAAELPGMHEGLRGFGQVELLRGQNRYVAAIREAIRVIESAGTA